MSVHPAIPESKRSTDDLTKAELLDLFGDEYTRRVYEAIAERPRSGRDVADAADVSRSTAYRRLNDLRDAGLVRTELTICEDGHHRERFEAVATSLTITLDDGDMAARVSVAD
ncbi:winged helix-turn-helix domain-containing protein [Haloplanus halophilus]|uniref:winged helix-turn-helix domain-containing protein n=1 Tax=Haloplanus halophilus TaxID=2949993 RepID=UPI00203A9066|nr:winged helix-turn-helix domain-containing protein [Haloplanus sp. GDY1]